MKKQLTPWWILPAILYFIHLIAVWAFASGNAHLTGPQADAGGMVWIAWFLIDFPIGFIAVGIGESMPTNTLGVWVVVLIGGIQWLIWGLIVTSVVRSVQKRSN